MGSIVRGALCSIGIFLILIQSMPSHSQQPSQEDRFLEASKQLKDISILEDLLISRGESCLIEIQVYGKEGLSKSNCMQFAAVMKDYTPKTQSYRESYSDLPDLAVAKVNEFQSQGIKKVGETPEPYRTYFIVSDPDKMARTTDVILKVTAAMKYLR